MSSKYSSPDSKLVDDNVALTDHAAIRYRQRTPHDCDIDPRDAWRMGEDIKHPEVAQSDNESTAPARVRVFKSHNDWGICFLVTESEPVNINGHQPMIVVTCVNIQGFDHGPARAYLHSHGPHTPEVNND